MLRILKRMDGAWFCKTINTFYAAYFQSPRRSGEGGKDRYQWNTCIHIFFFFYKNVVNTFCFPSVENCRIHIVFQILSLRCVIYLNLLWLEAILVFVSKLEQNVYLQSCLSINIIIY